MPEEDKKQEETDEKQEEQVEDESGLESDLENAEELSQESNFKSFMQPKIIPPTRAPTLDQLAPPQQENTFDDMLGRKEEKEDEKDKKSAMNYDMSVLRPGTDNQYKPRISSAPGTEAAPNLNLERVDLQTIGRGRARMGREVDMNQFRSMEGIPQGNQRKDEYIIKEDINFDKEKSTIMDNEPGFKPRKDYKP